MVEELTLRSPNPRRSSPASSSALGMWALPRPSEHLGFRTSGEQWARADAPGITSLKKLFTIINHAEGKSIFFFACPAFS